MEFATALRIAPLCVAVDWSLRTAAALSWRNEIMKWVPGVPIRANRASSFRFWQWRRMPFRLCRLPLGLRPHQECMALRLHPATSAANIRKMRLTVAEAIKISPAAMARLLSIVRPRVTLAIRFAHKASSGAGQLNAGASTLDNPIKTLGDNDSVSAGFRAVLFCPPKC
jgi:X-X-X-Leu-X-X-Gly heptad repeat protein